MKSPLLLVVLASCQLGLFPPAAGQEEYDARETLYVGLLARSLLGNYIVPCTSYDFGLPAGSPSPLQSPENCGTPDRVELGRLLFYDKRLSGDETMSCASCHRQEFAFSDRKVRPRGIAHGSFPSGELHPRNSQHLSNVAYNISLTWANSTQLTLESQAAGPLFAEEGPSTIVELGFNSSQLEKIKADIRQRRPTRLRPERFSIITDSIQKQNTPQNPCGNAVSLT